MCATFILVLPCQVSVVLDNLRRYAIESFIHAAAATCTNVPAKLLHWRGRRICCSDVNSV